MPPDLLQVGHGSRDFFSLCHRMDKVVQRSHLTPRKQSRRLPIPRISFLPRLKRDCVAPAGKRSGTEIGVPAPFELWIKSVQLQGIEIKMRQPRWDLGRVGWNGNLAPKNLEIDVGPDLGSKVAPNNRV